MALAVQAAVWVGLGAAVAVSEVDRAAGLAAARA